MDQPSSAGATSVPGSVSYHDRSRPAIAPSSAASPSVGTAIFACCSCRRLGRLGSCCCGQPIGPERQGKLEDLKSDLHTVRMVMKTEDRLGSRISPSKQSEP